MRLCSNQGLKWSLEGKVKSPKYPPLPHKLPCKPIKISGQHYNSTTLTGQCKTFTTPTLNPFSKPRHHLSPSSFLYHKPLPQLHSTSSATIHLRPHSTFTSLTSTEIERERLSRTLQSERKEKEAASWNLFCFCQWAWGKRGRGRAWVSFAFSKPHPAANCHHFHQFQPQLLQPLQPGTSRSIACEPRGEKLQLSAVRIIFFVR